MLAVGVSLGGNALLRWAEEAGDSAARTVRALASVCAPLDLAAGGAAIGRGFNRQVYTRAFLATMKPKALAKLAQHPGLFDRDALLAARDLYAFDNVFTAPLHGFRDTDDYWARGSARPHLHAIRVPTLAVNARNDPFVPAASLPRPDEVGRHVSLWQPDHGGHVGFPQGAPPGHVRALPEARRRLAGAAPVTAVRAAPGAQNAPMDDIVRQALAKWPNVPHCYGWLGLDARGSGTCATTRRSAPGLFPRSRGRGSSTTSCSSSSTATTSATPTASGSSRTGRSACTWSSRRRPGSGGSAGRLRRHARIPGWRSSRRPAWWTSGAVSTWSRRSGSAWSTRRTSAWPPRRSTKVAGNPRQCVRPNCRRASAMS